MLKAIVPTLLAVCAATPALAATLYVGAGKTYTTLSAAAAKANPGDTIIVYPGVYTAGATWSDSNLTIRAAAGSKPGSVIVRGGTVGGKALFVTKGDNITVQGIRFENARVTSGNGAGIRAEGKNLTVIDSQFYNNEMGILANSVAGSTITVRGSSFDYTRSRRSGSIGHSLYVNSIEKLVVENSTFTRGAVGHYIKSRARTATITGNTIDDTNGSASYLIDVSEGGGATIANNTLTKGAKASNCCTAIAYGFEMHKGGSYVNAPGTLLVSGNSFTNRRASTVTFFANRSVPPNPATLSGNEMIAVAGTIRLFSGPGTATTAVFAADMDGARALVEADLTTFNALGAEGVLSGSSFAMGMAPPELRNLPARISPALIPEPQMIALLAGGLAGVAAMRRRRGNPLR